MYRVFLTFDVATKPMAFFPNAENWQIGNWQIPTDMSIAIIKAQIRNFPQAFKDCITKNIRDIVTLRNKYINIYFIIVCQCKHFVLCVEMHDVSQPPFGNSVFGP